MTWWDDAESWLATDDGYSMLLMGCVLLVVVLTSVLLASWFGARAVKRVLAQRDREINAAAIGVLIDAATQAARWDALSPQEQLLSDRAVGQADLLVRMLPIRGASIAADWISHRLAEFKKASATFDYELAPAVAGFRDRVLDWQRRPRRASRRFREELAAWTVAAAAADDPNGARLTAR